MKILQISPAKCGSLWLWKILESIGKQAGIERKSYSRSQPFYPIARTWLLSFPEMADVDWLEVRPANCVYRMPCVLTLPIPDLDDYLRQTSHVWTHSEFNEGSSKVFPKFDRVIYLLRDPRDALISAAHFELTPFIREYSGMEPRPVEEYIQSYVENHGPSWVRHVGGYLLRREEFRIHFVFYENLVRAFDEELSRLLNYLEIELDAELREAIREETAFSKMKWENSQHVRRGRYGEWARILSEEQKQTVLRQVQPMLELLGYPTGEGVASSEDLDYSRLRVPSPSEREAIEKALTYTEKITFAENRQRVLGSKLRGEPSAVR